MVAPRVTRSSIRLANSSNGGAVGDVVSTSTEEVASSSAPIIVRPRSTRRAALDAKIRIAEETKRDLEKKRRSRRVRVAAAASDPLAYHNSPCLELKPAALSNGESGKGGVRGKKKGGGVGAGSMPSLKSEENADDEEDLSQLDGFTCAICLDKPDTIVDLATISGCSHKFCFDCIDKWAETENKCPCCKQRFRTIDRVKNLPPPTPTTPSSRRGKRKRTDDGANSGSNARRRTGGVTGEGGNGGDGAATAVAAPRVNSRTVEDRNQQHMSAGLGFALLERILNSALNMRPGGEGGVGMGPGGFGVETVNIGGGRGRTTFRIPVPPSMAGNDNDLNDMAGMLRMILQDATIGGPGGRFTIQVRSSNTSAAPSAPAPPAAAARASGGTMASGPSRSSNSPRRSPSSNPSSSNMAGSQRSTLFSYFGISPSSRRSRNTNNASRSQAARAPVPRRESGVIDLADDSD